MSSRNVAMIAAVLLFSGHASVVGAQKSAAPASAAKNDTTVKPKLSKAQVARVIRSHSKQVRHCYDRAAASDPTLAGQLGVQITIGSSGKVLSARLRYSTLSKRMVAGCVTHGIRSWVFPKPLGGGKVVFFYPLVFQQGHGKAVPKRLTRKLVQQGMRGVVEEMRRCRRFKQTGTAQVRTTIAQSGQVSAATLKGTLAKTEAGNCIRAAVLAARFPRFSGPPLSFSYPFVLR